MVSKNGLVFNHSYSIVGIYKIDLNDTKLNLIKLRNPTGDLEWLGDFSDK